MLSVATTSLTEATTTRAEALALVSEEMITLLLLVAIPMAPTPAETTSRHLETSTVPATLAMDRAKTTTMDRVSSLDRVVFTTKLLPLETLAMIPW